MIVDTVTVTWEPASGNPCFRILFYDLDGNLIESGDIISDTAVEGETTNFIVKTDAPYGIIYYASICAIDTNRYKDIVIGAYSHFNCVGNAAKTLEIKFKTIQLVSKIRLLNKVNSNCPNDCHLKIVSKDGEQMDIDIHSETVGEIKEYNFITYNTNKIGIAETTISTNTVHFLQFKI